MRRYLSVFARWRFGLSEILDSLAGHDQSKGEEEHQGRETVDDRQLGAVLDHAVNLEREGARTRPCHEKGDDKVVDREGKGQETARDDPCL